MIAAELSAPVSFAGRRSLLDTGPVTRNIAAGPRLLAIGFELCAGPAHARVYNTLDIPPSLKLWRHPGICYPFAVCMRCTPVQKL